MKLAYLVSRFPVATETFILRELNGVQRELGGVELLSLFGVREPFAHPAAEEWVPRLRRPGPGAAARALLWGLATRPAKLAGALADVVRGYGRRPRRLVRALATFPIAVAHARTLEQLRVDHVHAHWATFPALAAWTVRRLTGIPYSFTAHAHDIFIDATNLGRLIDDAAFVVTISDYNVAYLRRFGRGRTPVHVVRYGVEVDRYAFRAHRPPAEGPVRALVVASFKEYKGHRYLFEALALGGPELDRIELDLVGAGPDEAGLRDLVDGLGLGDRVRFLGTVAEHEVAELLAAADLAVLPSVVAASGDTEGLPNFLLEALAAGTPAISTAVAGSPELLREDATCLLALPRDAASLAAALGAAVRDGDASVRRAEAGRRLVERDYSVARAAAELASLFEGSTA